jgi:hypothetical protein
MLEALGEYLTERLGQHLDQMAVFLLDEFEVLITTRALASIGWSKKAGRRVAKEQNPDL